MGRCDAAPYGRITLRARWANLGGGCPLRQGNRVEQQVTQNGISTTTVYVGSLEQIATTGSTTTTTTYYYAGSMRIAEAVSGAFTYLASDGLGSAGVALTANGTAAASILYAPYGRARYGSGTMPTDYGFAGQHADSVSGLDYYNARYYDPLAGQFTSADAILPAVGGDVCGLSRYAYVEGNPIGRTDPSGNTTCFSDDPCYHDPGETGYNTLTNTTSPIGSIDIKALTKYGGITMGLTLWGINQELRNGPLQLADREAPGNGRCDLGRRIRPYKTLSICKRQ